MWVRVVVGFARKDSSCSRGWGSSGRGRRGGGREFGCGDSDFAAFAGGDLGEGGEDGGSQGIWVEQVEGDVAGVGLVAGGLDGEGGVGVAGAAVGPDRFDALGRARDFDTGVRGEQGGHGAVEIAVELGHQVLGGLAAQAQDLGLGFDIGVAVMQGVREDIAARGFPQGAEI